MNRELIYSLSVPEVAEDEPLVVALTSWKHSIGTHCWLSFRTEDTILSVYSPVDTIQRAFVFGIGLSIDRNSSESIDLAIDR